ncbi:MAG: hypothetical protein ACTHM0_09190 [Sphingomonas sp.]|jgi:hypothetical protein
MRAVLLLIVLIGIGAFLVWRMRRAQLREQRHAAWRARRAEEDRIWYEKMGEGPPGG